MNPMTRDELKTAKHLITQAICEHMPSAAVASGWMSEANPEPFVKAMCERFPLASRPENLAVTPLTAWLKERGVDAGKAFVMAVRKVWLMDAMRAEHQRLGGVCFADKA